MKVNRSRRTGCSISEKNLARLSRHPNAWGLKEASGNIAYAATAARYVSEDFRLFSGNDDIVVPLLSLGGSGVISVWANIAPKTVHDMCVRWQEGDARGALQMQLDNLELIHSLRALAQGGRGPRRSQARPRSWVPAPR